MKFRILFILFNFVIVAAFALVVFMPLMVLGWEYSRVFWVGNWPVAIVFAIVLAGLNTYFGINWQLFSLLEREDWSGLITHLEEKVLVRGKAGRQRLRVLINAYVVTGASEKITALEKHLRTQDIAWIARFPLEFGVPYLLSNDAEAMKRFFGELKEMPRCSEPIWVRWNYAFALMLNGESDEARAILVAIAGETRDPVQMLVTAYLLDSVAQDDDVARRSVDGIRTTLTTRYTAERWSRERDRDRSGLQQLVLATLIEKATDWAFGSGEDSDA